MAVYRYIRFSTDLQDEQSQCDIIEKYCTARGIAIDDTIRDEGISGKEGSLSRRDLLKLLQRLREGDTLVVSELSRLTRGGSVELNRMIGDYFRPAKIRLILCNYSMEFDCANLTPMNELILNSFAVFAKMERDSIVERTRAGLNARKVLIKRDGGFISKSGRWCTQLGGGNNIGEAVIAASKARTDARIAWEEQSEAFNLVAKRLEQGWSRAQILEDFAELYKLDSKRWCTRNGAQLSKGVLSKWCRMITESGRWIPMEQSERRNS